MAFVCFPHFLVSADLYFALFLSLFFVEFPCFLQPIATVRFALLFFVWLPRVLVSANLYFAFSLRPSLGFLHFGFSRSLLCFLLLSGFSRSLLCVFYYGFCLILSLFGFSRSLRYGLSYGFRLVLLTFCFQPISTLRSFCYCRSFSFLVFCSLSLLSVFSYCFSHGFLAFWCQPISTLRFFLKHFAWFPLILVPADLYFVFLLLSGFSRSHLYDAFLSMALA